MHCTRILPTRPALSALLVAGALLASACAPKPPPAVEEPLRVQPIETISPARTSVKDLGAFAEFIATRPTPDALRGRFPGLTVVLPGEIATKEFRNDNSRYFAELDGEGRVLGGRFQ